jgi:hypothetical protein
LEIWIDKHFPHADNSDMIKFLRISRQRSDAAGKTILLAIAFCGFAANAAQIANVEYVHNYILQSTELNLPPNPNANPKQAANIPYLTCIMDQLNQIGPYSAESQYCAYSAAGQAIDITYVWEAVRNLYNCSDGVGINSIDIENGAGKHVCYALPDIPIEQISGLKCHTGKTMNGIISCCDDNCASDPTVNKHGIYSMCYDPDADTYANCTAGDDKFRQIYYTQGACTKSVDEANGPPDVLNSIDWVPDETINSGYCWCRVIDMYGHVGQWHYYGYYSSECMKSAGRCSNKCARAVGDSGTLSSAMLGYKILKSLYDQTIGTDLPYLPVTQELLDCLSNSFSCSSNTRLLVPNIEF